MFPSPEKVGYPPASDVSISLFSPSQRDVHCCVVVISVTQPSLFHALFFKVRASSHLHPSLPTSYAGAGIISASKCHFHSASKVPLLFLLKHPHMFIEYLLSSFRLLFIVFLGKKKNWCRLWHVLTWASVPYKTFIMLCSFTSKMVARAFLRAVLY